MDVETKGRPHAQPDLEAWIIARCNYRPNGADIEIEVKVWETTGW
jgi:hypothetical protein